MSLACRVCAEPATKQCACKLAAYCGHVHRDADWVSPVGHRSDCTLRVAKCVECGNEARERTTPVAAALEMPVCTPGGKCAREHPYVYFAADKCPIDKTVAASLGECMAVQQSNGVWRINAALIAGKFGEGEKEGFERPAGKRPAGERSSSSSAAMISDLIAEVSVARGRYQQAVNAEHEARERVIAAEEAARAATRQVNTEKQAMEQAVDRQETQLISLLQRSTAVDDLSLSQFTTVMDLLSIGGGARALAGGRPVTSTPYTEPAEGSVQYKWIVDHSAAWMANRTPEQIDRYFHHAYSPIAQWSKWDLLMIRIMARVAQMPETKVELALAVALQLARVVVWRALYPRVTYETDEVRGQYMPWMARRLARVLEHPGLVALPTADAARQLVPELAAPNRYRDAVWPPRFVLAAAAYEDERLANAVVALPFVSITEPTQTTLTGMAAAMRFRNVVTTTVFAERGGGANSLSGATLRDIVIHGNTLPVLEAYFQRSNRMMHAPFWQAVRHQLTYRDMDDIKHYSRAILGVEVDTDDADDPMLDALVSRGKWQRVEPWVQSRALRATTPWGSELFATWLAQEDHYKQLKHILKEMQPDDQYDTSQFESPVARALLARDLTALDLYSRYGHFPLIGVQMRDRVGMLTTTEAYAMRVGPEAVNILRRVRGDDTPIRGTAAPAADELN